MKKNGRKQLRAAFKESGSELKRIQSLLQRVKTEEGKRDLALRALCLAWDRKIIYEHMRSQNREWVRGLSL